MTKKRKVYLLLAFISLFICIYTTSSTYAKYFSKTDSTQGYNIKKWNIKLNNEDIKTNHNLQEKIKINIDESEDIEKDKLAPDASGYFIIDLDYENVDLSFDYDIIIEGNEDLTDLIIYKIEINNNEYTSNNEEKNKISQSIDIENSENPKKQEIKVFIKWNDNTENGANMTNEEDTYIPINYENIDFQINVNITQKNSL